MRRQAANQNNDQGDAECHQDHAQHDRNALDQALFCFSKRFLSLVVGLSRFFGIVVVRPILLLCFHGVDSVVLYFIRILIIVVIEPYLLSGSRCMVVVIHCSAVTAVIRSVVHIVVIICIIIVDIPWRRRIVVLIVIIVDAVVSMVVFPGTGSRKSGIVRKDGLPVALVVVVLVVVVVRWFFIVEFIVVVVHIIIVNIVTLVSLWLAAPLQAIRDVPRGGLWRMVFGTTAIALGGSVRHQSSHCDTGIVARSMVVGVIIISIIIIIDDRSLFRFRRLLFLLGIPGDWFYLGRRRRRRRRRRLFRLFCWINNSCFCCCCYCLGILALLAAFRCCCCCCLLRFGLECFFFFSSRARRRQRRRSER